MRKRKKEPDDFWASISDLMSGLMIIFLFIAICYMIKVKEQEKKVTNMAQEYTETKKSIYDELAKEFGSELSKWNATIDSASLSVSFREPDGFFKQGQSDLDDKFKNILKDFFPRYIKILHQDKYKDDIAEIRIEGHTSTEGKIGENEQESYFSNMKLSQDRTRNTLYYIMKLDNMQKFHDFMIDKVTANGLSYSKKITINGIEDKNRSRRVEFKVRTTAEKKIDDILRYDNEKH